MKRSLRFSAGVTLIEVLLVMAILLVLGTVSVVAYTRIKAGADKNAAKLLINETVKAVELYHAAVNKFPETETGLQGLITAPEDEKEAEGWKNGGGPFLKGGKIPVDPWKNELKYEYVGESEAATGPPIHVWSLGPDGQDGTEDDIRNWTEETGM